MIVEYRPLPNLTHLQMLICWALQSPWWDGLTVRDLLAVLHRHDVGMSESSFYQLMQRMEQADLVVCELDESRRRRPGQKMLARKYRLTRTGRQELQRSQEFYRDHLEHPRRFFCSEFGVRLLTDDDWNGDRALLHDGDGKSTTSTGD